MEFFDSHSHYNDEKFNLDREEIINKTKEDGVTKFVCAGYDVPSSKFSVELAKKYPFIYSICGVSPNDVPEDEKDITGLVNEIENIINNDIDKRVVAVGEIGLDYYWNKENKKIQKLLFQGR